VPTSGVLVEQGVNCLFVKVNCRDRKGLLSDVVSALRAFPVVICTAAITTTKDGTVHDVFEVCAAASDKCIHQLSSGCAHIYAIVAFEVLLNTSCP
jgi:UTP:GlnB (protein PII) uridylyltransferase